MLREQVKNHISKLSDPALVKYVLTGQRIYEPEAIAFAEEELSRRHRTQLSLSTAWTNSLKRSLPHALLSVTYVPSTCVTHVVALDTCSTGALRNIVVLFS